MAMYVPPDRADLYLRLVGIKDAAETFGARASLRFRVSSVPTGAVAAAVPSVEGRRVGEKRLHLMRHGQGVHNAYRDDCTAAGKVPAAKLHEAATYPHLLDPVLTARGEAEAIAARAKTAVLTPELLVVSPLRRESTPTASDVHTHCFAAPFAAQRSFCAVHLQGRRTRASWRSISSGLPARRSWRTRSAARDSGPATSTVRNKTTADLPMGSTHGRRCPLAMASALCRFHPASCGPAVTAWSVQIAD